MQLNDLLEEVGIDPKTVIVMRHRPGEPELRKVLPWLAAERPDVYNAYQQTQSPRAEKAMTKAAYIASFIGHASGKALFVGLYKRGKWKTISPKAYRDRPAYKELAKFGHQGLPKDWSSIFWFDLELIDFYQRWQGKMIIDWPGGERSWYRWADRNEFKIDAILEESALDAAMPAWNALVVTWDELRVLPTKWKNSLKEWRGIYLIFDKNNRQGYVGSAYGKDNILGRWLNYAATGDGGNKGLKKRDPGNFLFSILQRVSPDMEAEDIIRLEANWKDRLHTLKFGMNEN